MTRVAASALALLDSRNATAIADIESNNNNNDANAFSVGRDQSNLLIASEDTATNAAISS
jgi:hypothetical protein